MRALGPLEPQSRLLERPDEALDEGREGGARPASGERSRARRQPSSGQPTSWQRPRPPRKGYAGQAIATIILIVASGATRLAGTRNYKLVYAPDFPLVRIVDARPGQVVTPELLAALGILAPEKPKPPPLPFAAGAKSPSPGGHGIEATAARLLQESTKAQENGEAYALKTAQHAEYAARARNAKLRTVRAPGRWTEAPARGDGGREGKG